MSTVPVEVVVDAVPSKVRNKSCTAFEFRVNCIDAGIDYVYTGVGPRSAVIAVRSASAKDLA
jgi:hypothetical protein